MISIICMCLPPLLMMLCREKWLGRKVNCGLDRDVKTLVKEYLISVLFLNLVVITITYKIFHHDGSIVNSLNDYAGFTFHYLLLSIALAVAEPIIENLLRFHTKITLVKFAIKENKINICVYAYGFILVLMNFIRIFDNSFWGDEGYSINMAKMSVLDMISATAADVHPPLHYLLGQLLYHVFGNAGSTYHLIGYLPYLIIVIIGCTLVKNYFGNIPAVILITMSSIMNSALTYNIEVRMYSLAALCILMAYIAYYQILSKNHWSNWAAFCISSLAAAYTHYYALLSVAFLYMMLFPLAIKNKKFRIGMIASYVITILGYLPWLMILIKSFERTANGWWLESIPSVRDCIYYLLDNKTIILFVLGVIILFLLYQINILKLNISPEKDVREKLDVALMFSDVKMTSNVYWTISGLASIAGTIVVGLALSYLIRPFLVLRYIFPLTGILYLMIGVCISKLKLPRVWGIALIILILWTHIPTCVNTIKWENSFDRGTANFLANVQPAASEKIVTNNSHFNWTLSGYYYADNAHECNTDALTNLNTEDDTVWLFWTEELDDVAIRSLRKQHYKTEKIYESNFANTYYRAYKLTRTK